MSQVHLTIPDHLNAYVSDQVAKGHYADASALVAAAIEKHRMEAVLQDLEASLIKGLESPLENMTDQDWSALERTGDEMIRRRSR